MVLLTKWRTRPNRRVRSAAARGHPLAAPCQGSAYADKLSRRLRAGDGFELEDVQGVGDLAVAYRSVADMETAKSQ